MVRHAVAASFIASAAVFAWVVAVGRLDPLAVAPPPVEANEQRSAMLGARSVEGYSIERLSYADGAPVWSASGLSVVREGSGFVAREPRAVIYSRSGGGTWLRAPRARFAGIAEGSNAGLGAVSGELEGGVSVLGSAVSLETERLSLDLPAAVGTAALGPRRVPSFDTRSPVRGTLLHAASDDRTGARPGLAGPAVTGLLSENGAEARGDLRRLVLRGPVHVRDSADELTLDASREAVIVLARAPWRVVLPFEGTLGALAGTPLLGRELHGGWVLALIEARGDVRLEIKGARAAFEARGDLVLARPLEGTLRVLGRQASLVEATSGCSVAAPRIVARDLGAAGIEVTARGGVVLGARAPASRTGTAGPREWLVEGDEAVALLVSSVAPRPRDRKAHEPRSEARHEPGRELAVRSATVTTSAAHPGRCRTVDGRFDGSFERFAMLDDPVAGVVATIEGSPAELVGEESHLRARSIELLRTPGEPDRLRLEGDVLVKLGPDLRDVAPVVTNGPIRATGERVALELDPDRGRKHVHWWQRGQVLDARAEGSPARLDAARPGGEPVHLEGGTLHFDLEKGLVSGEPAATSTAAVAVVGSSQLAARRIDADLAKGEIVARGGVRARSVRPQGELHLACERARWDVALDPARRKALHSGRPLAVPGELLGFVAEDDVKLDGPEGLLLEADRVELAGTTLVATRRSGLVHGTGQEVEVHARRFEARDLGEDARSVDLVGEATVARIHSGTKTTVAADRIHALGFVHAPLGRPEVFWGPVVAWQEGPGLVALRSKGPEGEFSGQGRVLRVYPRSGLASLEGSVGGELTGKNGVPFTFRAPRADVQLDAQEARARSRNKAAPRADLSGRIFSALRGFERFSSSGGVHAAYKEQTFDGESLEWDGHRALLEGAPLRVRDAATNMEFETKKMLLDLDAR